MKDVVIGAGQIGQAIARRVSVGEHILLADMRPDNANAAAGVLTNADTPDEVGNVGALLMDGGVTAAYWYGDLAPR